MTRLLIFSLLALTAANALAGNMYIYKDKGGQVLLTNVNPGIDVNAEKFTKKVKTTYYKDSDDYASESKEGESNQRRNVTYGSSSNSNSASYSNSAYLSLR